MSNQIVITRRSGNWVSGNIGDYTFEIKVFEQPSEFGIDEGRVSKLWIARRRTFGVVASYDRGWDKLPRFDDEIEVTQALIDQFN